MRLLPSTRQTRKSRRRKWQNVWDRGTATMAIHAEVLHRREMRMDSDFRLCSDGSVCTTNDQCIGETCGGGSVV